MGMNLGSPSSQKGLVSEINVTPFVDVVLVLLIIFMVTAPFMFNGVPLNLPKTKKVERLQLSKDHLILSITAKGDFYLGKDFIKKAEVIEKILKIFSGMAEKEQVIYIRADHSLKYGVIAETMADLKNSGITNVALVTENLK